LRISDEFLAVLARQTPRKIYQNKVVVCEYSDPNPFKVLHAGHLYTTLVGDVIGNLYEVAGAAIKRVNFGGDVGLHVARAMWSIMRAVGEQDAASFLGTIEKTKRPNWVSERYVEGNTAYEEDEQAKAEITALNKKIYELHASGDKTSSLAVAYWTCRQWSYDGFEVLYERLGVKKFDRYYPESVTAGQGLQAAREALKKGVLAESDGAVVFKGEEVGLHTRVFINSEGIPTYESKDLGLALSKWQDYHFDQSVMITGNDIVEYMKVVQRVVSSFAPEITERSKHLTHGMIKLAGGKKMSSRKGNVLLAQDVIDAAVEANKQSTGKDNMSVVLGAIKWAFLKNRIGGDIIYDPEESVSIVGNSGPYLQYAHARACSILRKVGGNGENEIGKSELETGERSLLRKLSHYVAVVDQAVEELAPHIICTYLYELAQAFNSFYEHNRVIDDPRQDVRLELVRLYQHTLASGLAVLGITAPEQM
jgi:arginyl-tRNA synthetase